MRWTILLLSTALFGDISSIRDFDQTYINKKLLAEGAIFDVMRQSMTAVNFVEGHKIYLNPKRIHTCDEGILLTCDDGSTIRLAKLYSDEYGCYIKSFLMCTSCGLDFPEDVPECQHCRSTP